MIAERHHVAAKVIATVDDLERIAADDAADVPALHGWRRELFGDKALALKHGALALAIEKAASPRSNADQRRATISARRRGGATAVTFQPAANFREPAHSEYR